MATSYPDGMPSSQSDPAGPAPEERPTWTPLESNPDVMTEYSRLLGASCGTWLDVPSFDFETLSCIPPPVVAVILLFATSPEFDKDVEREDEEIRQHELEVDPSVYFIKQTIGNACGAIAVLHSLANNTEELQVIEGPLKVLIDKSKELSPLERGHALEQSKEIESLHEAMAIAGQTSVPGPEDPIEPHFVAFVHHNGKLLELDGDRPCPMNRGPTSPENLLKDAVKICEERMETILSTPGVEESDAGDGARGEYRFAVFALTTAFVDLD